MSQSLSRRSFLKCAGSGAVSLAAALLTGVSAAAAQPRVMGQPALLDGKAAVELLGYAPAPGLGGVLVYLSVENLTAPGANVTRIGDRLLYTVTLANTGAANSCLVNAVISDPLPVGIEPAAGTLRLAAGGGASVPVPDGAYDHETRTIAVTCGDIWGGGSAALTFAN